MAETLGDERRRRLRIAVNKAVRTTAEALRHMGTLKDISGAGAAIEPSGNFKVGTEVEIDIEDLGIFPGQVARIAEDDDLFAVAFEIEPEEEDDLVTEITRIHDGIVGEEV
jgi:hypothetical protein